MKLNIAHKIFGIALVVLTLMAAVAVYSVQLTAEISAELDDVATKQLPLSDTIGRINVRVLEKGLLLQRLFALPEDSPATIVRINAIGEEVDAEFKRAYDLFEAEEHSAHPPDSIFALHGTLKRVEKEFRDLQKHSLELIDLHKTGQIAAFRALLHDFNAQQSAVDKEIDQLREHVEQVADGAVQRADDRERFLLYFNAIMTALSAGLGLGIAAAVTTVIVRNVRNLVYSAEAVEQGNLETVVPVITEDEVGRLANSFNEMVGGLRMKERIKDTFGKYMDPRIVNQLLDDPEFSKMGGNRYEMTVMFVDLKGYTSISEKLEPGELVHMINLFLGRMTEAISAHSGVINDFLGDAVMAYWGPPFTSKDDHATLACAAGVEAIDRFEDFKADVKAALGERADGLDLDFRIGISTGDMVAGNIGSTASRKFSVIGDPVNLGARLEGANKNYGTRVMIAERTRELAGATAEVRELDLIQVKGKTEPTRVYELRPQPYTMNAFAKGLDAYRAQDWATAVASFEYVAAATPEDPVPAVFLSRIRYLQDNPPGPDWDGVWAFETK